jgi:hypothetical protein
MSLISSAGQREPSANEAPPPRAFLLANAGTPLQKLSARDVNGSQRYDIRDARTWASHSEAARALVETANSAGVKTVVVGEVHGKSADARFFRIVDTANRSQRKPVAVIEGPTTPKVDALIKQLYAGSITRDAFLKAGTAELFGAYTRAPAIARNGGAAPLSPQHIRHMLERDVLRYFDATPRIPVVLADGGLLVPGANRDEIMARAASLASAAHPGRTVYVQTGYVHAQERPGLALKPEAASGEIGWHGVRQGRIDAARPLAARLAESQGAQKVLSVLFDDLLWTDEDGKPMRDKKGNLVHWSNLSLDLKEVDPKGQDWAIPFRAYDAIVPTRRDDERAP